MHGIALAPDLRALVGASEGTAAVNFRLSRRGKGSRSAGTKELDKNKE
jgi:hypothetical protein